MDDLNTTDSLTLPEVARLCAEAGLHVVRFDKDKKPIDYWKDWQPSPERIEAEFDAHADYRLGIAGGFNGFEAIDLDQREIYEPHVNEVRRLGGLSTFNRLYQEDSPNGKHLDYLLDGVDPAAFPGNQKLAMEKIGEDERGEPVFKQICRIAQTAHDRSLPTEVVSILAGQQMDEIENGQARSGATRRAIAAG